MIAVWVTSASLSGAGVTETAIMARVLTRLDGPDPVQARQDRQSPPPDARRRSCHEPSWPARVKCWLHQEQCARGWANRLRNPSSWGGKGAAWAGGLRQP